MHTVKVDINLPDSWRDLSQQQLRFVYRLVADGFNADEIKTLCLFKWSCLCLVGRQDNGSFLVRFNNVFFDVTSLALAELLSHLSWLDSPSRFPVRLDKIRGKSALPADFSEVPFEKFIMADNLYQGYLATENDELLDQLASVLYGGALSLKPFERISVFFWMISLKDFFSSKFSEFFRPASPSDLSALPDVEGAVNAQIRALTKGDITKEAQILSMDTWRALTELDAQAREFREMNAKFKS